MTEAEYTRKIRDALALLEAAGQSWGEITLVIIRGQIQHVNLNLEITDRRNDRTAKN